MDLLTSYSINVELIVCCSIVIVNRTGQILDQCKLVKRDPKIPLKALQAPFISIIRDFAFVCDPLKRRSRQSHGVQKMT